jgi:hypothetical protein
MSKYLKKINIQNKIKAFTLHEIVVALILSFFVLGILYLIYNILNQHLLKEYDNQFSKLLLLNSGIEMDFFYADSVIMESDHLYIFKDNQKKSYHFQQDMIIKSYGNETDTLFLGMLLKDLVYTAEKNWISQLELLIQEGKEEYLISFSKKYLPNQKLKNKEISFEY